MDAWWSPSTSTPPELAAGGLRITPTAGDLLGALEVARRDRDHAGSGRRLWVVAAATVQSVAPLDDAHHAPPGGRHAELQRRADLLAIHTRRRCPQLTPFARAAGRRLLVVEASGVGRAAPARGQGFGARRGGSLEVAVSGARDWADATALFASLSDFTGRHVGLLLVWRGEIEGMGWPRPCNADGVSGTRPKGPFSSACGRGRPRPA